MTAKKASAAPAAAPTSTSDPERVCPNCGGTRWRTITLTADPTDAKDRDVRQAAIDKTIAARGALLQCRDCRYKTHAKDDLTPATV